MAVILNIFLAVLAVSLVSILGILIFLKQKNLNRILLLLVSFAAGSLLGVAFLDLLPEAFESGLKDSIPIFILHLFILLFVMFFLFRDGKVFVDKIERLLPLKVRYRQHIFKKLSDMTYAVVYGSIIIAMIQGALGGIGFFIFGLSSPLLWGIVMVFAALIPYIGSTIIWFPAALMLIFNGYINLETTLMIKGILLMIYGIFVIGTVDNILKPKIIGDKAGLHPILVMLGVVGGLSLFGFIGVIVGPIILAMLVAFVDIYEEEKK